MKSLVTLLLAFTPLFVLSQWDKTGKPFQEKLDYYHAAKEYESSMDSVNSSDLIQYARVLYYQGEESKALEVFKVLMDKGELNTVKDLNAFHTCVMKMQYMSDADFLLKYGQTYTDAGIIGFSDTLIESKDEFLIQSTCFNSDEYEDLSPFIIGDQLCFVSARPSNSSDLGKYNYNNQFYYDIYTVDGCNVKPLKASKVLPANINTKFHDGPAHFVNDSSYFFLTRNIEYSTIINLGLVYSHRDSMGQWSSWTPFNFNSEFYSTQHPFFDATQGKLYFSSDMPGGNGGFDLYYSTLTDSGWSKPKNCGVDINSAGDEVFPYYHSGALYFSSNGYKSSGGLDIYLYSNGEIQSMVGLNSMGDDYGLIYLTDTSGLLTTNRSEGFGKDDILRFTVQQPRTKDEDLYLITSDESLVKVDFGEPKMAKLRVAIFDSKTKDWIESPTISLDITNINSGIRSQFTVEQDSVKINLGYLADDSIFQIEIRVNRNGYKPRKVIYKSITPQSGVLDLGNIYLFREPNYNPPPKTIDPELPIVYFDLDKSVIRNSEEHKLDSVAQILKAHPELRLEIKAFTDSRATFEYNLKLAEKRARATIAYLLTKNISRERCIYAVYGETNLVNDCGDNKDCNEQFHQLNRRVELGILH